MVVRMRCIGGGDEKLTKALIQLYKNQKLCDFTLISRDVSLKCHRLVLIAKCTYFERLLSTFSVNELDISEIVPPEYLSDLVNVFYTGDIKLVKEKAADWVVIADRLGLQTLSNFYKNYIIKNLTTKELIELSDRYSDNQLSPMTRYSLLSCVNGALDSALITFAATSDFLELDFNSVVRYLSRDSIWIPSEKYVFETVFRWIKAKHEERKDLEIDLIQKVVRLNEIPIKSLVNEMGTYPVVKRQKLDSTLKKAVSKTYPCWTRSHLIRHYNTRVIERETGTIALQMYDASAQRVFSHSITRRRTRHSFYTVNNGSIYAFGGESDSYYYQTGKPNPVISRFDISRNDEWTSLGAVLHGQLANYRTKGLSVAVNRSGTFLIGGTISFQSFYAPNVTETRFIKMTDLDGGDKVTSTYHASLSVPFNRATDKVLPFLVDISGSDVILLVTSRKLLQLDPTEMKWIELPAPMSPISNYNWVSNADYLFLNGPRSVLRYSLYAKKWSRSKNSVRDAGKFHMHIHRSDLVFVSPTDGMLKHQIGFEKFK